VPGDGPAVVGPEGVRELVSRYRRARPSLYVKIEDQVAEDDRVATQWLATTSVSGAEPIGAGDRRTPCCAGISIVRFLAGKQVDSRTECTALLT
jgi:hypothetical protein